MDVHLLARRHFRASPEAVFVLSADPQRFPSTFRGYGPIPAIRTITPHAPPAVGATRTLENSDGSRPHERITAFDPPLRHAYVLSGIAAPFSWLVRAGHADWPIAAPLLHGFFRPAMQRCLATMARALEPATEPR